MWLNGVKERQHRRGLTSRKTIVDIVDGNKYCGILQANGTLEQATRKALKTKYLQRVRQVLRSLLNDKNKTRETSRYPARIIRWAMKDIQTTNVKTPKFLPCTYTIPSQTQNPETKF